MPTKLSLFNNCLGILTQAAIANPDPEPASETTRTLNANWRSAVEFCLEQGDWDFAFETGALSQVLPAPKFRYQFYYALPGSCLRLVAVSPTGEKWDDLLDYEIHKGKIASNQAQLFAKWVDGSAVDLPGLWSAAFERYAAAELAVRCLKLNTDAAKIADTERSRARGVALGVDAVQNPPAFRKPGQWAQSIRTGRRTNADGGPTSSFS